MYLINLLKSLFICLVAANTFSSCATIIGGSNYNAYVNVVNHSNAKIYYKGTLLGSGRGITSIPRKDADSVTFKVSQKGCPEQEFNFYTKKFRGGAFGGSLFLSILMQGIPIPIIIDAAIGSLYKPDDADFMISKSNYKNFNYSLTYNCETASPETPEVPVNNSPARRVQTKEEKLIELKELYDKGMITDEEYKISRQAVLNQ